MPSFYFSSLRKFLDGQSAGNAQMGVYMRGTCRHSPTGLREAQRAEEQPGSLAGLPRATETRAGLRLPLSRGKRGPSLHRNRDQNYVKAPVSLVTDRHYPSVSSVSLALKSLETVPSSFHTVVDEIG